MKTKSAPAHMRRARRVKRVQLVLGLGALIGMAWRFWSQYAP